MRVPITALALSLGVLCAPTAAHADAGPKVRDSLWLPMGVNLGYSVNPDPLSNGFLLGTELSLVYIGKDFMWAGVYGDVLRDSGSKSTRMSVGAEAGAAIFGLDVGYVRQLSDPATDGFRARFLLSLAAVHLYGGVGHLFAEPEGQTYGEAGVLLKFPLMLVEAEPDDHHYRR